MLCRAYGEFIHNVNYTFAFYWQTLPASSKVVFMARASNLEILAYCTISEAPKGRIFGRSSANDPRLTSTTRLLLLLCIITLPSRWVWHIRSQQQLSRCQQLNTSSTPDFQKLKLTFKTSKRIILRSTAAQKNITSSATDKRSTHGCHLPVTKYPPVHSRQCVNKVRSSHKGDHLL